jgi:hypothetical protein
MTAAILGMTLLGAPLLAYIWETLNRLLSGQLELLRLALTVPAAVVFAVLLRLVGRTVERWQEAGARRQS